MASFHRRKARRLFSKGGKLGDNVFISL